MFTCSSVGRAWRPCHFSRFLPDGVPRFVLRGLDRLLGVGIVLVLFRRRGWGDGKLEVTHAVVVPREPSRASTAASGSVKPGTFLAASGGRCPSICCLSGV